MLFRIAHLTHYRYSQPVFLDPHEIRLRPRCDWTQRLHDFELAIEPEPAGIAHNIDVEGNATARIWFAGEHPYLRVEMRARVETLRDNPFAYLLAPGFDALPARYADESALVPYVQAEYASGPVAELGRELMRETGGRVVPFLRRLNEHIHAAHETEVRLEGGPLAAEQTLARGRGACRDLTVLFIAVCRSVGLAARFVSGYQAGDLDAREKERHMHAWAEVYLPGAGWRGYDPSFGLAVADKHVVVAAAAEPSTALPLVGHFRGEGAQAVLEVSIQLEAV